MFPFDPPENMFSGGSKGNIGKKRVNRKFDRCPNTYAITTIYILLSPRTDARLSFKSVQLKNLPKDIPKKCCNLSSDPDGI